MRGEGEQKQLKGGVWGGRRVGLNEGRGLFSGFPLEEFDSIDRQTPTWERDNGRVQSESIKGPFAMN